MLCSHLTMLQWRRWSLANMMKHELGLQQLRLSSRQPYIRVTSALILCCLDSKMEKFCYTKKLK